MRTKLCVLGAVLGTASVLPGALLPAVGTQQQTKQEPSRGPSSRRNGQPTRSPGAGQPASHEVPAGPSSQVPTHPCELITVMQVPCDASTTTCEYTYWECPRDVKPLSA
jgi:hypothetical protein